ncbi:XRE family transcriptional regulator [Pseudomonas mangiferae]|uniref:Helix-turn-helix transcriptional regulator n=1 Tax=Pseudomonas mangiferae TaxID=2593654 RepID=A0A553GY23_9PSED|nr:helix-turn-helix transcriptional regulator [Pseudomonas mangiferae]TRX74397.1 helix-turn-helix transcriptional regulator [Pseudomonas mangiferae]
MDFKDRLKTARRHAGLNQTELAKRCGMTQTSISDLERGKSVSTSFVANLAYACGVDPLWLANGAGQMIPAPAPKVAEASLFGSIAPWDSDTPLENDEVTLPLFKEVELSAGSGSTQVLELPGRKIRLARSTLREAGVEPENAVIAIVSGNSMERLILDGAGIGIDRGTTHIMDGEIYAFDHDGMLRVKYLYRLPGGGLRLRSENSEEHPDEIYSAEQAANIRILGWVFWWSTVRRRRGAPLAR